MCVIIMVMKKNKHITLASTTIFLHCWYPHKKFLRSMCASDKSTRCKLNEPFIEIKRFNGYGCCKVLDLVSAEH